MKKLDFLSLGGSHKDLFSLFTAFNTAYSGTLTTSAAFGKIIPRPLRESEFAYGRSEASPDSEQIEHTVAKPLMRNSVSVEQIKERVRVRGKRVAFTLAEVLITLGIIGVVAAMTMPTLIQNHKTKETVSKLKKFSSVMSQAMSLAIQNEGEIDTWGLSVATGASENATEEEIQEFKKKTDAATDIMVKYLKHIRYCPASSSDCEYHSRYTLDGTQFSQFSEKIVLADGSVINAVTISSPSCKTVKGTSEVLKNVCGEVFYDINGPKGPNATGKDVFLFYFTKSGAVIPMGSQAETSYTFEERCNKSNPNNINGYGCTAWVMYNENMDYLYCDDLSWNGKHKCK